MTDPLVPFRRSANPDAVGRLLAKAAPAMKTPALTPDARAKILSALPAAPPAAAAGMSWSVKALGLGAIGAGVLAGIVWTTHLASAPSSSTSSPIASAAPAVVAPESSATSPSVVAAPVFSVHDLPTAPVPSVSLAKAEERPAASSVPMEADTLAREVAILDRAQASTDPTTRLAVLAEHARAYPDGKLAPEREVFAVEALLRAGRRDEARRRGEAFIRAQPNGPHAARVRSLLTAEERHPFE